mmetsp:Transcript_13582/g.29958  ORF Transcript_13582/g.29958 Transcript_13582/m.29958 type:complete len:244 (+) Transcript_13582:227-958(+)
MSEESNGQQDHAQHPAQGSHSRTHTCTCNTTHIAFEMLSKSRGRGRAGGRGEGRGRAGGCGSGVVDDSAFWVHHLEQQVSLTGGVEGWGGIQPRTNTTAYTTTHTPHIVPSVQITRVQGARGDYRPGGEGRKDHSAQEGYFALHQRAQVGFNGFPRQCDALLYCFQSWGGRGRECREGRQGREGREDREGVGGRGSRGRLQLSKRWQHRDHLGALQLLLICAANANVRACNAFHSCISACTCG